MESREIETSGIFYPKSKFEVPVTVTVGIVGGVVSVTARNRGGPKMECNVEVKMPGRKTERFNCVVNERKINDLGHGVLMTVKSEYGFAQLDNENTWFVRSDPPKVPSEVQRLPYKKIVKLNNPEYE